MKRIFGVVVTMLVLCGLVRAGEPVGVTVATTNAAGTTILGASICILPQRGLVSDPVKWTAISGSVVRASQVIENSSGVRYYAVNSSGIAATNQPVHTSGLAIGAADEIVWQVFVETKALRTGLSVTKGTANGSAWVSVGRTAVASKGILLTTAGSTYLLPYGAPQDAIFVLPGATNDAVYAQDW